MEPIVVVQTIWSAGVGESRGVFDLAPAHHFTMCTDYVHVRQDVGMVLA